MKRAEAIEEHGERRRLILQAVDRWPFLVPVGSLELSGVVVRVKAARKTTHEERALLRDVGWVVSSAGAWVWGDR